MLTFPPNTFGETSTLLPVVLRGNGVVALAKPAGIAIDEHLWTAGQPTICGMLRQRLAQEQASAIALGLASPGAVLITDADCSGLVLLADRESGALELWRNAAGSGQLQFRFLFLTKPLGDAGTEASFQCSLPVAAHFSETRALISRTTGKKSETCFSRIEKFNDYELWSAETAFPRLHQVRLHALECGLPIVGDALYGDTPAVVNSVFSRKGRLNKGEERPLYAPACVHLAQVRVSAGTELGDATEINAPLPAGFEALLKKLRRASERLKQ